MKLTILFFLLLFTGVSTYTSAQKSPKKSNVTVKPKSTTANAGNGKALYAQYCLSCHMVDGYGVQNLNPPLIKTTYVLGDKVRLTKILLNGFSERVEIEGEMYNNVMPSFNYLSNQQIADVLTYVRSNFGNKASAVTVAEVTKIRAGK
ncbi:c-type cytochrome [Mucilaginibacter terrae]|uniref:c-type cytochrome n=1 Tax=Mucilaginibacter terrae TaxID=1955052 RepID=UPI003631E9F8